MHNVSHTSFPDGSVIKHPNCRMSAPLIQNIGEIMKAAALEESSKRWSKNKVKAGGIQYSEGQQSALKLAKRILKSA